MFSTVGNFVLDFLDNIFRSTGFILGVCFLLRFLTRKAKQEKLRPVFRTTMIVSACLVFLVCSMVQGATGNGTLGTIAAYVNFAAGCGVSAWGLILLRETVNW